MKSITIFSMALVALTASAVLGGPDGPVHFDDENLKQAIKETLGITTDPTEAQMATLEELNAENRGIAHLEGIESAKNLTNLSLRHNDISDIEPLTDLTELTWLDLRDNPLSVESYCCHLPQIEYNNVGIELLFDPPTIVYVDDDAPAGGDGSSWPTAYRYLQDALTVAADAPKPVEIRVGEGIYTPDSNSANPNGTGEREATFQLIDGVIIKGAYAGFGQADPNARDIEACKSTLSGDLEGNDVDVNDPCDLPSETTRSENSYNVVSCSWNDETAVLDGFTITGGNANGPILGNYLERYRLRSGSGMHSLGSSPTVTYCNFSGNSAHSGGGMYNYWDSYPILTNCTFSNNSALSGGGMDNDQSSPTLTNCTFSDNSALSGAGMDNTSHSNPILTNCTFSRNTAVTNGGGLHNDVCSPKLTGCTFNSNSVGSNGGGMYNHNTSSPTVTDCNFSGNSAGGKGGGVCNDQHGHLILTGCTFADNAAEYGGGMYNYGSNPSLTNCTFSRNTAVTNGGGLHNLVSSPTLTGCTFNSNSAGSDGGGMYNYNASSPTVTDCNFSGNSAAENGGGVCNESHGHLILTGCTFGGNAAEHGGGMHNKYSSPTLTNCTFSGNIAITNGGGLHNALYSSPILTGCTFSGNSANRGGGMYNTYASPILTGCTFSDNSEAYQGGGMYDDHSSSTLTNCTFIGNSAAGGGGMLNHRGNATLTNCTFSGNSAGNGGGMENDGSNRTLTNCTFNYNSAEYRGGGMDNDQSSPNLTNCTFSGNSAGLGGGMSSNLSSPTLTNCTFAQNSAQDGDALGCDSFEQNKPSNVELINCILWDGGDEIWNNDDSTINVKYSNIQDKDPNNVYPGTGNINADPCFAELGYWDLNGTPDDANDDFWVDGDYHLKSEAGRWDPNSQSWVQDDVSSLCIDAGDPAMCIFFEPNPNGRIINMGAYGGTAEASLSPSGVNCISDNHPDYDEWIKVDEPLCWCYHRQCHGDTDCKSQGKNNYWVSTEDLDILIAAWNKPFEEIEGQTLYGLDLVCADFDHKAQGKNNYRVSTNDLDILIDNWNSADKPDPNCP